MVNRRKLRAVIADNGCHKDAEDEDDIGYHRTDWYRHSRGSRRVAGTIMASCFGRLGTFGVCFETDIIQYHNTRDHEVSKENTDFQFLKSSKAGFDISKTKSRSDEGFSFSFQEIICRIFSRNL